MEKTSFFMSVPISFLNSSLAQSTKHESSQLSIMEHHHRSNLITPSQAHCYHIFHLVEDFDLRKQANV